MDTNIIQQIVELRKSDVSFRKIATQLNISKTMAQYYSSTVFPQKALAKQRCKRQDMKHRLVQRFGSQCRICGYKKYAGSLDFHHINPRGKTNSISNILKRGVSEDVFLSCVEEAKKCILLCSNCHKEIHAGITQLPTE